MTQASESAVRTIDTGVLPERYARGWHCLGLLADFRDGKPHAVQAFGTKLVVFAGADGRLSVLDEVGDDERAEPGGERDAGIVRVAAHVVVSVIPVLVPRLTLGAGDGRLGARRRGRALRAGAEDGTELHR